MYLHDCDQTELDLFQQATKPQSGLEYYDYFQFDLHLHTHIPTAVALPLKIKQSIHKQEQTIIHLFVASHADVLRGSSRVQKECVTNP